MTKQEQIIYKVASAISWGSSNDYIKGLVEMASIALGRDEQTIMEAARAKLASRLDQQEIDDLLQGKISR